MSDPRPDFDAIAQRYFAEVVNSALSTPERRQIEILAVYLEHMFNIENGLHGEGDSDE